MTIKVSFNFFMEAQLTFNAIDESLMAGHCFLAAAWAAASRAMGTRNGEQDT